jgi:hypothetical protein
VPLPTIPGVVRCSVRGLMPSGKQWANVLHCRYAGGASTPGTTEITALDAVLIRLWTGSAFGSGSAWLTNCATAVTTIDTTYYVLFGGAPPLIFAHAAAGSLATTSSPSEVACVVTHRTGTRGRSYRGRTYLPAPVTSHIAAGGVLQAADITSTLLQFSGAQTALNAIQWSIGVASYLHSTFADASSFTMDNRFDVIRHRKG